MKAPGDPEWGVRVKWYGHSCFTFQDSAGRLFLIDPFDETIGYSLAWVEPDAVLVTHEHFDHNHLRHAARYELVNSTGTHTVAGVEVTGIPGYHDNEEGRRNGTNRMYVWEMAGLRLAHLGDVGQDSLTAEQLAALKDVDVLFVPVGGKTTVDAPRAAAIVQAVRPRIAVPMHYGNEKVRFFEFDPVDPFLDIFENVLPLPDSGFQLTRGILPEDLTIYAPAVPD